MADTTQSAIQKESGLTPVTTFADTDLVRLVVGGKSTSIKKSDLVKVVREALIDASAEVTTLSTGQKLVMADTDKSGKLVTPQNLQTSLLGGHTLSMMEDGVFIMFHRASDNYPLMVKPYKWKSYENSGEIADGVAIVEGGHVLVVAPTEPPTTLLWSSAAITGGGTNTGDRVAAMNDWNGKANTAAQIAASTANAVTNTASYAPGFCNLYSRTNSKGAGLTAGKWWLPSVAEWMMVYANMQKVNYALSLISGATQLVENWYWTSTENGSSNAWGLYLNAGDLNLWGTKASGSVHVRAVSAFIF